MKTITSFSEWSTSLNGAGKHYLLLWKSGSEQSECANRNFRVAWESHPEIPAATADVSTVRDIHGVYGIASVPSLLVFEEGKLQNVFKGCHDESFFRAMLEEAAYHASAREGGAREKQVTIYTSPTCSWCNTLKQWLRKNHVHYHEIDVSRDTEAANDLVRRSGQMGVPQTDINGQIVVGFDQLKLRQLLEI
jgi:glutaredoxin-like YruB-family protein